MTEAPTNFCRLGLSVVDAMCPKVQLHPDHGTEYLGPLSFNSLESYVEYRVSVSLMKIGDLARDYIDRDRAMWDLLQADGDLY